MAEKHDTAWFGPGHSPMQGGNVTIAGRIFTVGIDGKLGLGIMAIAAPARKALGIRVDDVVVPRFHWGSGGGGGGGARK